MGGNDEHENEAWAEEKEGRQNMARQEESTSGAKVLQLLVGWRIRAQMGLTALKLVFEQGYLK